MPALQLVDEKQTEELQKLIDHHTNSISLWLRKMGLTLEERKRFWQDLSVRETDTIDFGSSRIRKPPVPATIIFETGTGMSHQPGLVSWVRPYPIDLEAGHFPFDYPLNQKQVSDFTQAGYQLTLFRDGTGFSYTSRALNGNRPTNELTLKTMDEIFNLSLTENEREKEHVRRDNPGKVGPTLIRREDASVGDPEDAACPT